MKPVVIKIGTGVLTREEDGQLDRGSLVRLVSAVTELVAGGHRCVLVSSGAVGAGISELGLSGYPEDVPTRQACAAVGQSRLMHAYQDAFADFDLKVAQVLLTSDAFGGGDSSSRLVDALCRLDDFSNVVTIVNENDSVAVEELSLGDNDMLSARMAKLIGAKLLILLSNIDGLLSPGGEEIVRNVDCVDEVLNFVREEKGRFSIGGMGSKLRAVQYAVDSGVETVIGNGRKPERLIEVVEGGGYCTRFGV